MTEGAIAAALSRLLRGQTQSESVGQYTLTCEGEFLYAAHARETQLGFALPRDRAEGEAGVKLFKSAAGEKFIAWFKGKRSKEGEEGVERAIRSIILSPEAGGEE